MKRKYIPFGTVRANVTFAMAADLVEVHLQGTGNTRRTHCPKCDHDRMAVTEDEGFMCHKCGLSGDVIAFVAAFQNCEMYHAAKMLMEAYVDNSATVPEREPEPAEGINALSHIDPEHELVTSLGFSPKDAERLGVGYAKKGLMRGHVAIPLRTEDGTIVGYLGVKEGRLPPSLKFPDNIVRFPKKTA